MTRKLQHRGFTLLEVLVALVIVALGLMAAFGQVNQSLTAATRLRDKTLAHWVAVDRLTELRLLGEFPALGTRTDEIEMANSNWRYTLKVTKTDFENLRQIEVSVAFEEQPKGIIATVTGLVGRPPAAPPGETSEANWFPVAGDTQL